ncbi:hypothetical protein A9K97_gp249 [Tokyovirus A1]|uniref:hypothetical protein n=1 Tax=Tokyovirus A1 TaxID=1826170 RepID=UPI0007A98D60|nr:hypothetical protein A9K97_gp249 [Tokyovirus A1]BAU80102.1 hypothetical protein [Tokyovirus A1]
MESFFEKRELVSFFANGEGRLPLKRQHLTTKIKQEKQGWKEYLVKEKFLPGDVKHGKQYKKKKRNGVVTGFSASYRDGIPHGKFWLKRLKRGKLSHISGSFEKGKLEWLELKTKEEPTFHISHVDGIPSTCEIKEEGTSFRVYDKEERRFFPAKVGYPYRKVRTEKTERSAPLLVGLQTSIFTKRRDSTNNLMRKVGKKFSLPRVYGKGVCGELFEIVVPFSWCAFPENSKKGL